MGAQRRELGRGGGTMEEKLQAHQVEIDPDFEPQSRPRSCTWPLPHPDFAAEDEDGGAAGPPPALAAGGAEGTENAAAAPAERRAAAAAAAAPPPPGADVGQLRKAKTSRRNAWGNLSYADLITKAIESSPEKRLTLSQIYDWMVRYVPYFKDKGDSNSSAGWKVPATTPTRPAERLCPAPGAPPPVLGGPAARSGCGQGSAACPGSVRLGPASPAALGPVPDRAGAPRSSPHRARRHRGEGRPQRPPAPGAPGVRLRDGGRRCWGCWGLPACSQPTGVCSAWGPLVSPGRCPQAASLPACGSTGAASPAPRRPHSSKLASPDPSPTGVCEPPSPGCAAPEPAGGTGGWGGCPDPHHPPGTLLLSGSVVGRGRDRLCPDGVSKKETVSLKPSPKPCHLQRD